MSEIRANGRILFMLGLALLVAGAVIVLAGSGAAGIVVAVIGVILLVVGWVGEQRRSEAELPHPPTK
jgi:membrane protein implicated in regulation of membrane protease activity